MLNIHQPQDLLSGLSPQEFMKKYWQKKPLLVKGAFQDFKPVLSRRELFDLAASKEVESRLVQMSGNIAKPKWSMREGPIKSGQRPALSVEGWTLLVQGVDLIYPEAAKLLRAFRFIPDARLDDLMISYATNQGGVGPHFDSYDVFLIQASGQRLWRIGRQKDLSLREDLPLKILQNFEPQKEYLLNPGDMLYLPPRYAHEGIAVGECMTYSAGFRAPSAALLAQEMLLRLGDEATDLVDMGIYRDPHQEAVSNTSAAQIPKNLQYFASKALAKTIQEPQIFNRLLGEILSEPKDHVWFQASSSTAQPKTSDRRVIDTPEFASHKSLKRVLSAGVRLDDKTKCLYDDHHLFINGESWLASGADKKLMRLLANQRTLTRAQISRASPGAMQLIGNWLDAGWVHTIA
jgi:50S ribosomal protein L16 3-hydroxylase